jgi:hypothetical protein
MNRAFASAALMLSLASLLASCASQTPMTPAAPEVEVQPGASVFNARDFAWSVAPGAGSIIGALAYDAGGQRYDCRGRDVILTPETPWSRLRMVILYGSATRAAVPLEIVRARTPSAPTGDYARFVRKTTCDNDNRFSFAGLPSGAWFVLTLARPESGGDPVAIMRRVETNGAMRPLTLN